MTEPADEIARLEAIQLAARPRLPSFAPEEFFFTFDSVEHDVLRYSGFYLDLGGRGLVSTVTMPLEYDGQNGVLALDIVARDRLEAALRPRSRRRLRRRRSR